MEGRTGDDEVAPVGLVQLRDKRRAVRGAGVLLAARRMSVTLSPGGQEGDGEDARGRVLSTTRNKHVNTIHDRSARKGDWTGRLS